MAAQSFTAEIAYTLGRGARLVARGWRHCEHHAAGWLVANGVAPSAARLLLDGAKFVALGAFFFLASWLAALIAFAIAAACMAPFVRNDTEEPEWRHGLMGFGLYHPDGSRIDPYDPDDVE